MQVSSLRLQVAAAGLGVAVLASGCGLMEPKVERYVAPPDGSSYVIQRLDKGSYGKTNGQVPIKVGRQMVQGTEMVTFKGPAVSVVALPTGNWVSMYAGEKLLMSWNPPIGWEYPLEVGKAWTKQYESTNHATKRTTAFTSAQKVEAYEDVTVPAGTFKAFRVSSRTSTGDENVVWYAAELGIWVKASLRRTASHPAGPGTREDVLLSQDIRK